MSVTKKEIETQITSTVQRVNDILMKNVGRLQKSYDWDDILFKLLEDVNTRFDGYKKDNHKTIPLKYRGELVEIDEQIAPLMSQIWKAKITTLNSCQDNVPSGYIWIQFDSSRDCDQFLTIIFKNQDINSPAVIPIYKRAMHPYNHKLSGHWEYRVNLESLEQNDSEESEDLTTFNPILLVGTAVSVRFPQQDLDFIYQRFLEYNL